MPSLETIFIALIKNPTLVKDLMEKIERTYGAVHKAIPVNMNGKKGFLIWDYILFNELTFLDDESGKITSLFTSLSDDEMEKRFNEFQEKYGA